jgi:hypothetical protein
MSCVLRREMPVVGCESGDKGAGGRLMSMGRELGLKCRR